MAKSEWIIARGEMPENLADAIEALLMQGGVKGVQRIDAEHLPPGEEHPPKAGHCRIEFYLARETPQGMASPASVEKIWHETIARQYPEREDCKLSFSELKDDNWATSWQSFFHPMHIGHSMWVGPSWEKVKPGPGEFVIEIDPGLAFGTGGHETTSLVLRELESLGEQGFLPSSMLDVGCGSGILSIAAAKLGVEHIDAIDNSEEAVRVARENIEINEIDPSICRISDTPIEDLSGEYPLVCANIISSILLQLKTQLVRLTRKGGILLLSGLLEIELQELENAFTEQGMTIEQSRIDGEWALIRLKKS